MGVVLFIAASAIFGVRLLLLYRRLRQPPELLLGLGYLVAGTLGWGGLLVGTLLTPQGHVLPEFYSAWHVIVGDIGTFFFYLFVWYMFRRESAVAKAILGLVALVFAVSLGRDTFVNGVTFGVPPGTLTAFAGSLARTLVFAWMAGEAFVSYFAFRRRARIGLGNPLVASRLLLWGISAVLNFALAVVAVTLYVTASDSVEATVRQAQAGGVYGALAALSSCALWLAFFPPKAYQNWLEKPQQRAGDNG